MPFPYIPDDVFSEILSHLFNPPNTQPTPLAHSSPLLLVSKRVRELTLPLFWRSITLTRSSHFVALFDPKKGLLHHGSLAVDRRGWIRELCIDAAVPYDPKKLSKTFNKRTAVLQKDRGYDLHVKLSPAALPNLVRLVLGDPGYLVPGPRGFEEEPSYQDLARRLGIDEISSDPDWDGEETKTDRLIRSVGWPWDHYADRNNEIIRSLLEPVGAQLRSLAIPCGFFVGWEEVKMYNSIPVEDPRLPSSLKQAQNLFVNLWSYQHDFACEGSVELLVAVRGKLPQTARVEISSGWYNGMLGYDGPHQHGFPEMLVEAVGMLEKEEQEKWVDWTIVEKDGSSTPLVRSHSS